MRLFSSLLLALSATVCVAVTGCSAPTSDTSVEDTGGATEALGQGINVPNPAGTYIANITANGTGCPAGTWDASISDDGKAFTVTFSQYEGSVAPGQAFAIKDCQLGIDLKTPAGFSFAVDSFYYQGYSLLDSPGMNARMTSKYYFMGNPVPGVDFQSNMDGPYDDSYVFSNDIAVANLVWSPCGTTRRLNAQTRLILKNNADKSGSGYLNASTADGQINDVFVFGFTWRKC
jgi:hypothetical protein